MGITNSPMHATASLTINRPSNAFRPKVGGYLVSTTEGKSHHNMKIKTSSDVVINVVNETKTRINTLSGLMNNFQKNSK